MDIGINNIDQRDNTITPKISDELSELAYKNGKSGTMTHVIPHKPIKINDVFNNLFPIIVNDRNRTDIDMKKYPKISKAKYAVFGGEYATIESTSVVGEPSRTNDICV